MANVRKPRVHVKFGRKPAGGVSSAANGGQSSAPSWKVQGNPGRESKSRIPFVGGLVAIAGMVAVVFALNIEKDDPHFVKARDSVRGYEYGKSEDRRNYSQPLYQEALDELARVGSTSISIDPANELANEIRLGIDRFNARQDDRQRTVKSATTQREKRSQAISLGIERQRVMQQKVYPECGDEDSDGDGDPDS